LRSHSSLVCRKTPSWDQLSCYFMTNSRVVLIEEDSFLCTPKAAELCENRGVEMKKTRNKQSPTSLNVAISRPILIVRWIASRRERNEIEELHSDRRLDKAIGYVDATSRTEVIDAVERWLANDMAQILYIGAHGIPTGLVDGPHSQEEITWQSLGRTLAK